MWRGAGGCYLLNAANGDLQTALNAWQMHINSAKQMGLNTWRLAFFAQWEGACKLPSYTDQVSCEAAGGTWSSYYNECLLPQHRTKDVCELGGGTWYPSGGLNIQFNPDPNTQIPPNDSLHKMDAVIDLLYQNGIKSILDYHGAQDQFFAGNTDTALNPLLKTMWEQIAQHYVDDERVVAYEIYNEPLANYGTWYQHTKRNVAEKYNELTQAIRTIDPNHIIIWQTPTWYIPDFDEILDLLLPNVVYTSHQWWSSENRLNLLRTVGPEKEAYKAFNPLLYWRDLYNIPIWLGEYGGPSGGSGDDPYPGTSSNPDGQLCWDVCAHLTWIAEDQVVPWAVWLGATHTWQNRMALYTGLLPPVNLNTDLVRRPYNSIAPPYLYNYVLACHDEHGNTINDIDYFDGYEARMWHNGDFITFKSGIIIDVKTQHRPSGTTDPWIEETVRLTLTEPTTIMNSEGGGEDWNTYIYSIDYARATLNGCIRDSMGNPIQGATVKLRS